MLINLIKIELYKIFKKWRSYIGFAAIGLLVIVIVIAISIEGNFYLREINRSLKDNFFFVGNLLNGWLISYILMNFLYLHIPFLIVLVTGDLLAGEGTAGTYRFLLIRPISRFSVILTKYISGLIYVFLLILFLAIFSAGLGIIIFGTGELLVIRDKIMILPENDLLWRFVYAYILAFLSMSVVASVSFLLSSLVNNSIGPIIGTMAIIIFFLVLSNLNFEFMTSIKPYLFTTHFTIWQEVFDDPIDWSSVFYSVKILLIYSAFLFALTYLLFRKKDILS